MNPVLARRDDDWLERLQRWLFTDLSGRPRLGRLLSDRRLLWAAVGKLSQAKGRDTPGVDGVALGDLGEPELVQLVGELAREIRMGNYVPEKLRSAWIEDDGKKRQIRIPTVRDRVVQHGLLLLLEPVVERELLPAAFACRPGLGPPHAVRAMLDVLNSVPGPCYFVEVDVKQCFDNIQHERLEALLRSRVSGWQFWRVLLRQLQAWRKKSGRGVPQGGPLSPLLANLYLAVVDEAGWSDGRYCYFRYLDDMVLVVPGGEGRARQIDAELTTALQSIGLTRNEEKAVVAPVEQGVEFLGITVRRIAPGELQLDIAPKNIRKLERRIKTALAEGADEQHLQELISSWVSAYDTIDEQLGRRAIRQVELVTSSSWPYRRSSRSRASGVLRAVPPWMRSETASCTGGSGPAQPAPGVREQEHSRPGQLVNTNAFEAPGPDALVRLSDVELGEELERATVWHDYFCASLATVQNDIHFRRTVRRRLYQLAAKAGQEIETLEPESPDTILRASTEYDELLRNERACRARARHLEKQVRDVHDYIVAVRDEMFGRALDHGVVLEPGRELLARRGSGRQSRRAS